MATVIADNEFLCADCGLIVANDDDSGIEDPEAHHAAMAAHYAWYWEGSGTLVVAGCPEDKSCDFEGRDGHICRYDHEFSSVACAGCATTLAGHRFAAVVLSD